MEKKEKSKSNSSYTCCQMDKHGMTDRARKQLKKRQKSELYISTNNVA